MRPSIKKYLKVLLNLVIALVILLLFIYLVPKAIVFFMPFIVGYIVALIANPLVRFFEEKLKIKRRAGSVFVIVAVLALVILCLYLIGSKLVQEIIGFIEALPQLWTDIEADFAEFGNKFSVIYERLPLNIKDALDESATALSSYFGDLIAKISSPTIEAVGNFAKQVPSAVIALVMALLSSYFFVAEKHTVSQFVCDYLPKSLWDRYMIIKRCICFWL